MSCNRVFVRCEALYFLVRVFFPLEISLWEVPSFYDSIHLQFCTKIAPLSNSVIDLVVDEIQNLQYFQWMHHKAIEEASTD
ncbi:hypothetical protein TB1_045038 [Malus domestica]